MTSTQPLEIDLDLPDDDGLEGRGSGQVWWLHPEDHTVRWVSRAAWTVFLLGLAVFLVRGADRTVRPKLIPAGHAVPSHTVPGFDEVAFQIAGSKVASDQAKVKHCGLLASTEAQRQRGLMKLQTLMGYEGMVFQFAQPTTTPFYMKDTLIPLSIAWFAPSGLFTSQTDMLPCQSGTSCPLYHPARPYTFALEVPQGYLQVLSVGAGAIMSFGGPCGA
ncbi:MAG TPA: DUF192 domain-containing protein [Acidimicrobiales bacterium]